MNRRAVLALATGTLATMTVGCLGMGAGDDGPNPEEDPFPVDVANAERGGADTTVSTTIDEERDLQDGSIQCSNEVHEVVRAHLDDAFEDTSDIGTGVGNTPAEFDGIAVTVTLITAVYDRDGDLVREAEIDFEEAVSNTPPTAYVQTTDDDRICAVPVYVQAVELSDD